MIKYITKRLNKSQKLKVENKIIQKKTDREKKVAFYGFFYRPREIFPVENVSVRRTTKY